MGWLCLGGRYFPYYSYRRNHTGQEFVVPTRTHRGKAVKINSELDSWYGASLGGQKTHKSDILQVFMMSLFSSGTPIPRAQLHFRRSFIIIITLNYYISHPN